MRLGVARFDGRTYGRRLNATIDVPEAGGPASLNQAGPYAMTGLAKVADPLAPVQPLATRFEVTLAGATAVRLDVARMALSSTTPLTGLVRSDTGAVVRLAGSWSVAPTVTVNGAAVFAPLSGGVLTVPVPTGESAIAIG